MTPRRLLLWLLALLALTAVPASAAVDPGAARSESVVRLGEDVVVSGTVERVVVLDGDVRLAPTAHVTGDVTVIAGTLRRDPGATVDGSEYVLDRGLVDWIPGPAWVTGLVLVALLLAYRAAVWWAVAAIAATLPGTATYERWNRGWEWRRWLTLLIGVALVGALIPAIALLALTVALLPVALVLLALLLVAAGAGLALFREGPAWPRRLPRAALVAYIVLPPALEIGLLLTAAGGLGAGVVALSRAAGARSSGA